MCQPGSEKICAISAYQNALLAGPSSHVEFPMGINNSNCVEYHLMSIPAIRVLLMGQLVSEK
jgi:hypothetical protein